MGTITVASSKLIDAPPERLYAFRVDFRTPHPKILPAKNFIDYRVDASTGRIVEQEESSTLRTTARSAPDLRGRVGPFGDRVRLIG
jgi:hypothetical protein